MAPFFRGWFSSVCCTVPAYQCRCYVPVNCLQGGYEPALNVRLDIFHALQRISKLCKSKHGAFKPFMARLRDACFIVNLDDIKEASVVDAFVIGRMDIFGFRK